MSKSKNESKESNDNTATKVKIASRAKKTVKSSKSSLTKEQAKNAQNSQGQEIFEKDIESLKLLFEDLRSEHDEKTIELYSEADLEKLPPVTLAKCESDPEVDGKVIDGWFIILALKKAEKTTVRCQNETVVNKDEAYIKALEKNCHHGKHLTREEKIKAAQKLSEKGIPQTRIGKILGVNQSNVSRMLSSNRQEPMRTHSSKTIKDLKKIIEKAIEISDEITEAEGFQEIGEIKTGLEGYLNSLQEMLSEDEDDDSEVSAAPEEEEPTNDS